jgi:hypothetical protein
MLLIDMLYFKIKCKRRTFRIYAPLNGSRLTKNIWKDLRAIVNSKEREKGRKMKRKVLHFIL